MGNGSSTGQSNYDIKDSLREVKERNERYDALSQRNNFEVCRKEEDNRHTWQDVSNIYDGYKEVLFTGNPTKDIKINPAKVYSVAKVTGSIISSSMDQYSGALDRIENCVEAKGQTRYNPMANHDCTAPVRFGVPTYKDPTQDPFMRGSGRPRNGF